MERAYEYLELEAAFFADRRGKTIPDLIQRYRLVDLLSQ